MREQRRRRTKEKKHRNRQRCDEGARERKTRRRHKTQGKTNNATINRARKDIRRNRGQWNKACEKSVSKAHTTRDKAVHRDGRNRQRKGKTDHSQRFLFTLRTLRCPSSFTIIDCRVHPAGQRSYPVAVAVAVLVIRRSLS